MLHRLTGLKSVSPFVVVGGGDIRNGSFVMSQRPTLSFKSAVSEGLTRTVAPGGDGVKRATGLVAKTSSSSIAHGRGVFDASALEAQFTGQSAGGRHGAVADSEEDDVIEFDDEFNAETFGNGAAVSQSGGFDFSAANARMAAPASYSAAAVSLPHGASRTRPVMTVEELEAQLAAGAELSPPAAGRKMDRESMAGPPPGLAASAAPVSEPKVSLLSHGSNATHERPAPTVGSASSSTALPRDDPNRGFMNRFERDLIVRIHTTQLTTDTPHLDDFYYQALTKRRQQQALQSGDDHSVPVLYFPLPSAAERLREQQRRQQRRKLREKEGAREKDGARDKDDAPLSAAALVLGKVSHSSSRKPRQQLQIPAVGDANSGPTASLHEQVVRGIEAVYGAVLGVEDFYLREQSRVAESHDGGVSRGTTAAAASAQQLEQLTVQAGATIARELRLHAASNGGPQSENAPHHHHYFIHFLTIPKGKAVLPRALKLLSAGDKERFLALLVEYFDFLDVVRPETSLATVDAFITLVLSPLVPFVGEAEWDPVAAALEGLFAKRSFVWIALTKAGMVLLCILLSRLEILKAAADDSLVIERCAQLTEKIFDALDGHLLEFFHQPSVHAAGHAAGPGPVPPPYEDTREFYAWQFMALLAMNVDADRKRTMILELRDRILAVVEGGVSKAISNLNVFLNALGLDASQLQ